MKRVVAAAVLLTFAVLNVSALTLHTSEFTYPLAGLQLLSAPVANEQGDIVFMASDSGGVIHLYLLRGGALSSLSSAPGPVFTGYQGSLALNENRTLAFVGETIAGQGVFTLRLDQPETSAIAVATSNATMSQFRSPAINISNSVAFAAGNDTGTAEFVSRAGVLSRLTDLQENVGDPDINEKGDVFFFTGHTAASQFLYRVTAGGVTNVLLSPGWDGQLAYASLGALDANDLGDVVFSAVPAAFGTSGVLSAGTNGTAQVLHSGRGHAFSGGFFTFVGVNDDRIAAYFEDSQSAYDILGLTYIATGISTTLLTTTSGWVPQRTVQTMAINRNGLLRHGTTMFIGMLLDDGVWYIVSTPEERRRARNDFDGDGRSDIGVIDPTSWTWFLRRENSAPVVFQFGFSGVTQVSDHYDGDLRSDPAVYNPLNGNWYINSSVHGLVTVKLGGFGYTPAPADYDGDTSIDPAVYQGKTGDVLAQDTRGLVAVADFAPSKLTVGVPGYFDNDDFMDPAVYLTRSGVWHVQLANAPTPFDLTFGSRTTTAVPADYDGDGIDDFAVYDRISGLWSISGSASGFQSIQFGFAGAIPVPGDFDGDGRSDLCVYDPASANWYLGMSSSGFVVIPFGYPGVMPIGGKR